MAQVQRDGLHGVDLAGLAALLGVLGRGVEVALGVGVEHALVRLDLRFQAVGLVHVGVEGALLFFRPGAIALGVQEGLGGAVFQGELLPQCLNAHDDLSVEQ